jgi:hypothetical protein
MTTMQKVIFSFANLCVLTLLLTEVNHAAPTVSNIRVDAVSYSAARVTWDTTGGTVSNYIQRIRYGTTTNYESGPGGGIQFQRNLPVTANYQMALSGLAPNTEYHICPQVSDDNGQSWSACTDVTFTTAQRPADTPLPPNPPESFDTSYPDTSGYTIRDIAADCSNLQSEINNAVANQAQAGSVIRIPAGAVCTGTYTTPADPAAKYFSAQDVNTATSRITLANHGFSVGQAVRFARQAGSCLPGSSPGVPDVFCQLRGPVIQGRVYYIRDVTPNDFQVAETPGGAPLTFTDAGSGTSGVMAWPPAHSNWIIIRTATDDNEFCPDGVRCRGVKWKSRMATLQIPGGTYNFSTVAFSPGLFAHHIRLTGLEITHSDASANLNGSTDPRPTYGLLDFDAGKALSYITIDRSYVHGLGYPNRLYRPIISWDGKYMAIVNSDMSQWDYWRPGKTGFGVSFSNSTVTVMPGAYQLSANTACVTSSPLIFSYASGTSNLSSFVYLGLDCTPTLAVPAGVTASCSGIALQVATPRPCVVVQMALPALPKDPYGGFACGPLAQITSSGSGWNNAYDPYGYAPSAYITEGTNGMIGGWGPGPYKLENNYSEGVGLLWHFDDSAGKASIGSGYTVRRNTFYMDPAKRTNGLGSNGLRYMNRNGIEWKNGTNILIEGNSWDGFWADVSSTGCAIVLTGIGGGRVADAEIRHNTITRSSCFISAIGGIPFSVGVTQPFQRLRIRNNLVVGLNGWTQYEPQARNQAAAFPFYLGYAMEDVTVDHNTLFDNRGPSPQTFHWIANPTSGVSVTNNILWMNNDGGSYGFSAEIDSRNAPVCSGVAKTAMDCLWRSGAGVPSYVFRRNLLVPYFANSRTQTGLVSTAATASAYNGLPQVWVQSGGDIASRLSGVGFVNPDQGDFRLNAQSPYKSGGPNNATDGTDLGADVELLEAVQGKVRNVREIEITSSSAKISFYAPDEFGCAVDYSQNRSFTTFVRKPNPGGTRNQSVVLDNLAAGQQYHYRVLCAVEQPGGSFRTLE